jgi:DNA-binding NarL/FixJ family response regulator
VKSDLTSDSGTGGTAGRVRVLAIDDHHSLGQLLGIAITAQDDMTFLGYATGAAAGIDLVTRTRPDVVIMDVRLNDRDGLRTAAHIVHDQPETRVIILTAAQDAYIVQQAAAVGACAFLSKSGPLSQLLRAIRTARPGHMLVDADLLAATSPPRRAHPQSGVAAALLTDREEEVLQQMASGLDATRIARRLTISVNTSRGHIKSIMSKLHCHTQLETLAAATRLGLVHVRRPESEGPDPSEIHRTLQN